MVDNQQNVCFLLLGWEFHFAGIRSAVLHLELIVFIITHHDPHFGYYHDPGWGPHHCVYHPDLVLLPTEAVSGLLLNFKSEASVSTKVKVGNLRWTLISIEFNLILYSLIQLRSSRPLWPLDPSTRQASVHLAFPSCKGLTSSGSKKVWQDYFCLWQMLKFAIYLFLEGSAMVIFKLGKFSFSPSLDCFPLTGSALHPFLKDSRNIFINRRTRRVGLATMLIEHLNSDPKQL